MNNRILGWSGYFSLFSYPVYFRYRGAFRKKILISVRLSLSWKIGVIEDLGEPFVEIRRKLRIVFRNHPL